MTIFCGTSQEARVTHRDLTERLKRRKYCHFHKRGSELQKFENELFCEPEHRAVHGIFGLVDNDLGLFVCLFVCLFVSFFLSFFSDICFVLFCIFFVVCGTSYFLPSIFIFSSLFIFLFIASPFPRFTNLQTAPAFFPNINCLQIRVLVTCISSLPCYSTAG
jgi:hypothetical protein